MMLEWDSQNLNLLTVVLCCWSNGYFIMQQQLKQNYDEPALETLTFLTPDACTTKLDYQELKFHKKWTIIIDQYRK